MTMADDRRPIPASYYEARRGAPTQPIATAARMSRRWYRAIPGFRTAKVPKIAVGLVAYLVIAAWIIQTPTNPPLGILGILCITIIALAFNVGRIRSRLPVFGSSNRIVAAGGWSTLAIAVFVVATLTVPQAGPPASSSSAADVSDRSPTPETQASSIASSTGKQSATSPSPRPSPTQRQLIEDLTFTGGLSGHMSNAINPKPYANARPSAQGFEFPTSTRCGQWSDEYGAYWQADIVGNVGSGAWALSLSYDRTMSKPTTFQINGKPGANDGDADAWIEPSSFPANTHSWYATYGALGSFTVGADLRSGSIDLVLPEGPTGAGTPIHVRGTWRCE